MSLTKKDLSHKLKQELNLTLETTDLLVDEFFNTIKKSLRDSKVVKFSGFGTFEVFRTKARSGRNPNTSLLYTTPSPRDSDSSSITSSA